MVTLTTWAHTNSGTVTLDIPQPGYLCSHFLENKETSYVSRKPLEGQVPISNVEQPVTDVPARPPSSHPRHKSGIPSLHMKSRMWIKTHSKSNIQKRKRPTFRTLDYQLKSQDTFSSLFCKGQCITKSR